MNRMNFGRGYINCDWISFPRLTTLERDTIIPNPSIGQLIDNIDTNEIQRFNGIQWSSIGSGGSSAGIYNLASPTNVTVGALAAGTAIAGLTWQEIFESMTSTYLSPTFPSFSIASQATLMEVGMPLSGNKTFTWSSTNPSNIEPNTISIFDITSNTNIATFLSNDGIETVNIGTIDTSIAGTQSWRLTATNTNNVPFQSSTFSVSRIYPYFYGKSSSLPIADQSLISLGNKVLGHSNGTISITFDANNEYIWFAIPQTSSDKTRWYVNEINQGGIGLNTDLFNNDQIVIIDSPTALWSNINYRIYISNYQTSTTGVMELRNT